MLYLVILLAILSGVLLLLLWRAVHRMISLNWEIKTLQECIKFEEGEHDRQEVG